MGILIAHVISLKIDVNKGIKAITDKISDKLGVPNINISDIKDTTPVQKELADLAVLFRNSEKEQEIRYGWNGSWMNSNELIDSLGVTLFNQGKYILGKALELNDVGTSEYVKMVDECASIAKKYATPVKEAAIVGF